MNNVISMNYWQDLFFSEPTEPGIYILLRSGKEEETTLENLQQLLQVYRRGDINLYWRKKPVEKIGAGVLSEQQKKTLAIAQAVNHKPYHFGSSEINSIGTKQEEKIQNSMSVFIPPKRISFVDKVEKAKTETKQIKEDKINKKRIYKFSECKTKGERREFIQRVVNQEEKIVDSIKNKKTNKTKIVKNNLVHFKNAMKQIGISFLTFEQYKEFIDLKKLKGKPAFSEQRIQYLLKQREIKLNKKQRKAS